MIRILVSVVVAAFLTACATATPYQPEERGFGYSERRIEDNRFRVRFTGNDATDRDRVESYLLYRAAELTVQHGGTHFLIADTDTEASTTFSQHFTGGLGVGRFSRLGLGAGIGTGTVRPQSTRYAAQAYVLVLEAAPAGDSAQAFRAESVIEHLGPMIQRPVN